MIFFSLLRALLLLGREQTNCLKVNSTAITFTCTISGGYTQEAVSRSKYRAVRALLVSYKEGKDRKEIWNILCRTNWSLKSVNGHMLLTFLSHLSFSNSCSVARRTRLTSSRSFALGQSFWFLKSQFSQFSIWSADTSCSASSLLLTSVWPNPRVYFSWL